MLARKPCETFMLKNRGRLTTQNHHGANMSIISQSKHEI